MINFGVRYSVFGVRYLMSNIERRISNTERGNPLIPIQTPVMNRLGQILNPNIRTTRKISGGAGHLQDPIVRPGGKLKSIFGVRYSVFDIRCSTFGVRHSVFDIRCSVFDIRCSAFGVRYSVFDIRCSIFNVEYRTPNIECRNSLTPPIAPHGLEASGRGSPRY